MKYFEWYVSYITSTANPYTIGTSTYIDAYMQCNLMKLYNKEWMNEWTA